MYQITLYTEDPLPGDLPILEMLGPQVSLRREQPGQLTLRCPSWEEACSLVSVAGRIPAVQNIYLSGGKQEGAQSVG